ncbi:hypothetical protein ES705_48094 [subsurface metagenome]
MLENIPLRESYGEGTIGAGAKTGYIELDKLLKRLSEPSVPDKERIERVRQVLLGLPRGQKPYYCKISFVSPISAVHTRRIEIKQNGMESGRQDIDTAGPNEFYTVEYGTDKSICINFYQYPDEEKDPNAVQQLGPFEGRWAIMKVLRECNDYDLMVSSGQIQILLPVPDKDENDNNIEKQLYLKLEFFRDKEGEFPIKGFGQALLSTE